MNITIIGASAGVGLEATRRALGRNHKEWEIKKVTINSLSVIYKIGEIDLNNQQPNLTHYSEGIKVIAWKRQKI